MRLLPYATTHYSSPLPLAEIMRRVQANTASLPEGWRGWLAARPSQPYLGRVYEAAGRFEVQRNSSYRNSFLPLISGTAEVPGGVAALGQPDTGSSVQLTMRLQVFVRIFLLVWLSGVSFACLAVVLSRPGPVGLIPFGMLAFGLLLTSISFRIEADKAESFFKDLLLLTRASD